MRTLLTAAALAFGLAASAYAAEPTAQQSKMTTCNKEAGDKKGDERKAFMKTCLSAKASAEKTAAADKKTAQQAKMTSCNKDAGDKKGDERKAFMKTCLSAKT